MDQVINSEIFWSHRSPGRGQKADKVRMKCSVKSLLVNSGKITVGNVKCILNVISLAMFSEQPVSYVLVDDYPLVN